MKSEYNEDDFEDMLPFLEMMEEEMNLENDSENDSIVDYWNDYHKDDGDFNEEYDEMSDSEEKAYNIYNEEILSEYEDESNNPEISDGLE